MRLITTTRLGIFLGLLLSACSGGIAGVDAGAGAGNNDLGTDPDGFPSQDSGLKDPACPGTPLMSAGALNGDLKTIQVSGVVTLNGQPLPDAAQLRGSLQFTERKTNATVSISLKSTGPATYQLVLAPGTYDVRFIANPLLCQKLDNAIPCISGVLQQSLALTASGSVSWDLKPVVVSGAVTLNGGALPGGTDIRGSLAFTSTDGSQVDSSVNTTSLSSYRLVLFPGVYAVGYKTRVTACAQGGGLPRLPPYPAGLRRRRLCRLHERTPAQWRDVE